MSKHSKFIQTPIFNILQECVLACNGLDDGIETQPLHEYIMQSVFLKMTGASEQKLKCICWEMATEDYEYRRDYIKNNHGECSSYKDKNDIYKDIIEQIKKIDSNFKIEKLFEEKDNSTSDIKDFKTKEKDTKDIIKQIEELDSNFYIEQLLNNKSKDENETKNKEEIIRDIIKLNSEFYNENLLNNKNNSKGKSKDGNKAKNKFIKDIKDNITNLIEKSIISKWLEQEFAFFKSKNGSGNVKDSQICNNDGLFQSALKDDFDKYVFRHRNRCAHNLISYQENLPTLSTLTDENYKYQNYFYRFYILILLDEIFMKLYAKYLEAIKNYHI